MPTRGNNKTLRLDWAMELIHLVNELPVVPHKVVAEVSKIGNL